MYNENSVYKKSYRYILQLLLHKDLLSSAISPFDHRLLKYSLIRLKPLELF